MLQNHEPAFVGTGTKKRDNHDPLTKSTKHKHEQERAPIQIQKTVHAQGTAVNEIRAGWILGSKFNLAGQCAISGMTSFNGQEGRRREIAHIDGDRTGKLTQQTL